jgi:nucleotide-binding universal stress UspA family protein
MRRGMPFQKILCPIDFSAGSRQAMRTAIRLANEAGAELVLAHAWYNPPASFADDQSFSPGVLEDVQGGAEAALEEASREATALGATRLATRLLGGTPRHEILGLLEHDQAFDLVVLGTHGHTGLARVLLGSVAESVVRRAPCSVLVVRPDGEPRPFGRVLCPIDFSEDSQQALELAVRLVDPAGEGIALLHVIDPPAVYTRAQQALELAQELDQSTAQHLGQWAAALAGTTPTPVTTLSRIGRPGAEILKLLEEDPGFDLVVTGSHGRTGLERVLLGSVAEKVVRHAGRPVLVARPRRATA